AFCSVLFVFLLQRKFPFQPIQLGLVDTLARERTVFNQRLDDFFYEKRRAFGLTEDLVLEGSKRSAMSKQRREKFVRFGVAERCQAHLCIIGLLSPLVVILRAVINQKQ